LRCNKSSQKAARQDTLSGYVAFLGGAAMLEQTKTPLDHVKATMTQLSHVKMASSGDERS
jgi:hypothetical protein